MMSFLSYLISGLGLGSVYAIIALGYSMVYGIAKMLNFAHGDIIMIGAFAAYFCIYTYHLPVFVAVIISVVVCTVLGVVIERLAYKPLREASSLSVLITAIGILLPGERCDDAVGNGYEDFSDDSERFSECRGSQYLLHNPGHDCSLHCHHAGTYLVHQQHENRTCDACMF